jgi:hypothetical protein
LINAGSTLGGNGSVSGSVQMASSGTNISPGATGSGSTAVLNTGAVTMVSGGNFNVDLTNSTGGLAGQGAANTLAGTNYDQLISSGAISLSGANLMITPGSGLQVGDKFYILNNSGSSTNSGVFGNAAGPTIFAANNGDLFSINYFDNADGGSLPNDVSLTLTAGPEPSTWGAAAWAAAVIGYQFSVIRRRKQAAAVVGLVGR